MEVEWTEQDEESFAHASKLRVGGKSAAGPLKAEVVSPSHATTKGEAAILGARAGTSVPRSALVVAGEALGRSTLEGVGYDKNATDALIERMRARSLPDRINLVYCRLPGRYVSTEGITMPMPPLDDLRASALVDVQLESGASLVIPPLPTGLSSSKIFVRSLDRTIVAIQTSSGSRDIVGHIPTTDSLELARDMVRTYVQNGVRFFAIDFSGASNQPSLMRTVVRTLRESLGLKRRSRLRDERYYLHIFNAAASRKSSNLVSPLSDIITHPYGVDSTSGQMWGGGTLDPEKLRYYRVSDYGAYRRRGLKGDQLNCQCPTCKGRSVGEIYSGSPSKIQENLRIHRVFSYSEECGRITERMPLGGTQRGYVPYLSEKKVAAVDIEKVLTDVGEIRAAL